MKNPKRTPAPASTHQRISMRDIAAKIGVSHTTVSLALKDHPRISKQVCEQIKKTAEEMGYRPDPMLSALANYRRGRGDAKISAGIAWINAWENPNQLRRYKEFDCYWSGASRAAAKLGYRLEEFRVNQDFSPKRLHQVLSTRAIRGILLPPHGDHPPVWEDFPWSLYSVVRYGRSIPDPPFHVVTADQVLNTTLAFRKILERGYERIGFVDCREATVKPGHLFLAGFLAAQTALEESLRIPVLNLSLTPDTGRHKDVAQWVKKHRVEAILTSFSDLPLILKKAHLRVPEDVALAGTTIFDTAISAGINQHPEEIGRVGMLLLNSLINDRDTGVPTIYRQSLVEGSWIDGDSLPHPG